MLTNESNPIESTTKHVQWIDIARGIGILLVILGHFGGLGIIETFIYSFHLPLFFFLSGYLSKNNLSILSFLKKKAKTLLLPYVFLSLGIIIFLIFFNIYQGTFSWSFLVSTFLAFCIQKREGTVWFLTCLFFVEIIFYFLSKYLNKYILLAVCCLMPTLGLLYIHFQGPVLPWNIDVCFFAISFYYVGYLFKYHLHLFEYILKNNIRIIFAFVICLAVNVGFCILNYKLCGQGLEMFGSCYGIYPFTFVSAIGGIFVTIFISIKIQSNILSHIGANSLIYFGWHQQIFMPVAWAIWSRIENYLSCDLNWNNFILFIIVLSACGIVENIVTRTKLKMFLGKF